jgi:hypothetical protein
MSTFQVDGTKVAELVGLMAHALEDRRVHLADIVIALSELCGRTIASQEISRLAMQELHSVACEHMERSIRIGALNKGLVFEDS